MKVYNLYKVVYREPNPDYTKLGLYINLDLAKKYAVKFAKERGINTNNIVIETPNQYHYDYTDLNGNDADYPYDGIIIEELEVIEC